MENRREPRFDIQAGAVVRLHRDGEVVSATTVNISGCGALLQFEAPIPIAVGDVVVCDLDVSDEQGDMLPCWVDGTVVRVDGARVAVDFRAGSWSHDRPPASSKAP
jgi:hypothetical protein